MKDIGEFKKAFPGDRLLHVSEVGGFPPAEMPAVNDPEKAWKLAMPTIPNPFGEVRLQDFGAIPGVVHRFEDALQSAAWKESEADLTEDERAAICMAACVPYEFDPITGKITFGPHGLHKSLGKWQVVLPGGC